MVVCNKWASFIFDHWTDDQANSITVIGLIEGITFTRQQDVDISPRQIVRVSLYITEK